jgi:vacuolar-type H+-ATPase subunit E/Vma4
VTLEAALAAALADARAEADAIRRLAEERTAELLAEARAEAATLVDRRHAEAQRLAERERMERLAEARAEARATILRAQRMVQTGAMTAAHAAARRITSTPGYERLIERLSAEARERLSSVGATEIIAAPGGGVVARAGSCEIDYSLDAQVERCLWDMQGEIERLWR